MLHYLGALWTTPAVSWELHLHKPRISSRHLLRLVNSCCNARLLLWNPRASHGAAKGNYRHFRASIVSPSGWNKTTRCTCSRLRHNFSPQHIYWYAFVKQLLQLRVSLRFKAPRYEAYCKIWVKILFSQKIEPINGYHLSPQSSQPQRLLIRSCFLMGKV